MIIILIPLFIINKPVIIAAIFLRGRGGKCLVCQAFELLVTPSAFGQLSITQDGKNTLIGFEQETLAILQGVNANLLTEADFISIR